MSAIIVIISDSEDDSAQHQEQQQRQQKCDEQPVTVAPAQPSRVGSGIVSSSSGSSSQSHTAINRSPVVIVPGTPPTPFAPEHIVSSLPVRNVAVVSGKAIDLDDLNCSDDDFEENFLQCILPKPNAPHGLPRQAAARSRRPRKNLKAYSSAASAASGHVPAPMQVAPAAVVRSHQAEHGEAHPGDSHFHSTVIRAGHDASDWDEAEVSRAIALSLADQHSSPGLIDIDDALFHNYLHPALSSRSSAPIVTDCIFEKYAVVEPCAVTACSSEGNHGSDSVPNCADKCAICDEATITGGCMPPSPGQGQGEHGAAAAQDDSILDVSFHDDHLLGKPVSKRKTHIDSAAAKQQQKKHHQEAREDVEFTPNLKRPRARSGTKVSSQAARSEEDAAREQSEILSRKNLAAALKSAKLGLLRPGVAAECRLHVFVDTGITATERGTDIIKELQQRFSPGNIHVVPCPVTRSLHLSRVNMMIGDGGGVQEIVEEELPVVGLLCSPTEVAAEARAVSSASAWVHGPIIQRLRDGDRLLPGRHWYLLVEDARSNGIMADCVQLMLLKVAQAMADRCVVRHIVESRSKEKLCMLTTQWVASVADSPFKGRVDVIDVHGKHMHSNVSYDAKAGPLSAWKATLFAMPGFTEMTVEPLVQRFPTLRAFMQHAREVGPERAAAELAGLKCGSTGQRRLGPVRAQRLLTAFTSNDTSVMFGPHTEGL